MFIFLIIVGAAWY
ncbi:YjcZ family sporulation protein [Bacillus sp. MM2020_1]|nr:YjcZ family sporulation protein [Bacillus sp. MM2020_1]